MHVVVFEKGNMPTEFVIVTKVQDFVNEVPAWFVGRMRFTRKNDLHRPPPVMEQLFQALEIAE
jgi:hypothetical protein